MISENFEDEKELETVYTRHLDVTHVIYNYLLAVCSKQEGV
jgi:hypothetical protein